jgi:hypothetical protein
MRAGSISVYRAGLVAALLLGGCAKSPIGPSGALTVTVPVPVAPGNGTTIAPTAQPVRLSVENATSTAPGSPVVYTFEVATDAGFASKVVTRDVPQAPGQTSTTLDPLPAGQRYFWRARATSGDVTGEPSPTTSFTIAPIVTVEAPVPVAPINGAIVAGTMPTLTVTNAVRSGPVGLVIYRFEIATDAAFTAIVASGAASEGDTRTSFTPATDLAYLTTYYWRARAMDTAHDVKGPPSGAARFSTPIDPRTFLKGAQR